MDYRFVVDNCPAITTTSIILSSNKIQNIDILVLAYPSCPEKWLLNERCASLQIEVVLSLHDSDVNKASNFKTKASVPGCFSKMKHGVVKECWILRVYDWQNSGQNVLNELSAEICIEITTDYYSKD